MTDEYAPTPEVAALPRHEQMTYILEHRQAHTIDGILIDVLSAKVYMLVYESLSETAQKGMENYSLKDAMALCWRCVK